jgi:hypothetical protein
MPAVRHSVAAASPSLLTNEHKPHSMPTISSFTLTDEHMPQSVPVISLFFGRSRYIDISRLIPIDPG